MLREFGLDKVELLLSASNVAFADGFQAVHDNPINTDNGQPVHNSTLCITEGGVVVAGKLLRVNTPDFQFSVKPGRAGSGPICLAQCSAAAGADDNLNPLDRDGASEAVLRLQRGLADRGIVGDWERARLVRLDLTRGLLMDEPPANYMPVLGAVGVRKRVKRMEYGDSGVTVGNKQTRNTFYDKAREMREKGRDASQCPPNYLRGEHSILKGRGIVAAVGALTPVDLRANWGALLPAYCGAMEREIFKPSNDRGELPACFDYAAMLSYHRELSKRPLASFANENGLMSFVHEVGLQRAKWLVESLLCDLSTRQGKGTRDRWFRDLESAAVRLDMSGQDSGCSPRLTLYRELREKVLRPVGLSLAA